MDPERLAWVPGKTVTFDLGASRQLWDAETGISVRLLRDYDFAAPTRLDVLYGFASMRPNMADPSGPYLREMFDAAAKDLAARIDVDVARRAYRLVNQALELPSRRIVTLE